MQLLELSQMLDGATTPHLLLPGVAVPGRDCQEEGDDGCLHAFSAYARAMIPPFPSCSGWLECSKCTRADGIAGLDHLGPSPPCCCAFVYVEVSRWGLIFLFGFFIVVHYSLLPFTPFKFASHD